MINTSLFTAQSGDYSVITKAITADDAKAVGLIQTSDNVHIGLTLLGYGFYQFI